MKSEKAIWAIMLVKLPIALVSLAGMIYMGLYSRVFGAAAIMAFFWLMPYFDRDL